MPTGIDIAIIDLVEIAHLSSFRVWLKTEAFKIFGGV
jgi:hypothetical protein